MIQIILRQDSFDEDNIKQVCMICAWDELKEISNINKKFQNCCA